MVELMDCANAIGVRMTCRRTKRLVAALLTIDAARELAEGLRVALDAIDKLQEGQRYDG